MAGTFHFRGTQAIEQGATCSWQFDIYEGSEATPGEELDLTGYTIRIQARESAESEDVIFEADNDAIGGITLVAASGRFTLTISAEDSALLPAGQYIHQIELDNGSGDVQRLLAGEFVVTAEVVR